MTPRIRRRAFLWLLGAGAVGVWLGVGAVRRRLGPRPLARTLGRFEGIGRTPLSRLQRHYAWLAVAPGTFEAYLADHERAFGPTGRFGRTEPQFYTRFLVSTDFWVNGRETPRTDPVSYVTLYQAGASPCYNPLALPPPTDAEL